VRKCHALAAYPYGSVSETRSGCRQHRLAGLLLVFGARKKPPGGAAFSWKVTRENNCYILIVTGSVSVKLRADSAGRTISFSPV
jgi:hypothetical protein